MFDPAPIQNALTQAGIDGWLFYDFHHRDELSYRILGLDDGKTSRRWFYLIPAKGTPTKIVHRVEPTRLDALPGKERPYRAWTELHEALRATLAGSNRVAMQYSPMNEIPYVSTVDAGTVELVRSCGVEVVSSADLVQQFEAVTDEAGLESHRRAGAIVQRVKDEAYARMGEALRNGESVTEYAIMRGILDGFADAGLTSDGDTPIVGFNDHPANPHFHPTEEGAYTLKRGDTILIDLWAREIDPPGIYYDVTWCGYAGDDDPPAEYVAIWKAATEARDAALQLVRDRIAAGDTLHGYEVDRVSRDVIERAGYGDQFAHRTGHSIGHHVHGNGANIDDLETRDTRRIVPGTCFSIEPGIYFEGRMGVRTEIDVCVTPDAKVEVAGPIQRDLIRVG